MGGCHPVPALFISFRFPSMPLPTLKTQEIPLDHSDSQCMFNPGPAKPFLVTPAAMDLYGDYILRCLIILQERARIDHGLDYLQVFEDTTKPEALWFIEDGDGGAITALLPSDY
jgi:hypothetical protein